MSTCRCFATVITRQSMNYARLNIMSLPKIALTDVAIIVR